MPFGWTNRPCRLSFRLPVTTISKIATLSERPFRLMEAINNMEAIDGQLDRARRGEPEALSPLYPLLLPAAFGYIAPRVPDRATPADLTSQVFAQMLKGISRLRAPAKALLV